MINQNQKTKSSHAQIYLIKTYLSRMTLRQVHNEHYNNNKSPEISVHFNSSEKSGAAQHFTNYNCVYHTKCIAIM